MQLQEDAQKIITSLQEKLSSDYREELEEIIRKFQEAHGIISQEITNRQSTVDRENIDDLLILAVKNHDLDAVKRLLDQGKISEENFMKSYEIAQNNSYQEIALEITKKQSTNKAS